MPRGYRWLVAAALVMSLGACSTMKGWFEVDDEDDPKQPAELTDIEDTVEIDKLWSQGVGDGQGAGFYKIQPVISGSTIYVAAADGTLEPLSRRRRRRDREISSHGRPPHRPQPQAAG